MASSVEQVRQMTTDCTCAPLAELQGHLIVDGLPSRDALKRLTGLEGHGLIERCPEHPRNWRITDDGMRQVMEMTEA